ncbi:hypothetical protein AURDEDRAFT_171975 [Auricularia subglabra TFB-10046 SS5]|nr:hypothetical protein AURDEDRAFT_171975 [Auricularia subglabra TFB-10046 SS5]
MGVPPIYDEYMRPESVHRALEADLGDWLHATRESDIWKRYTKRLIASQRRGKPSQRLLEDIREQYIKVSQIHDVAEEALLDAWRLRDEDWQDTLGQFSAVTYTVSDALSELLSFYDAKGIVLEQAFDRNELSGP